MSIKNYNKYVNIQNLTKGNIESAVPLNRELMVTTSIPLYQLEILQQVNELIEESQDVAIKIGYKG